MTRKECLDMAAQCVLQDRANQYGGPEDTFGRIAKLWSAYLGTKLDGTDVAAMMGLLKIARLRANPTHGDSWVDLAGYAACGAELAGKAEAYKKFIEKYGAEYKKLRAKAEGDAKAEDEYHPGEPVEYQVILPSVSDPAWIDATYVGPLPNGKGHIVATQKRDRIAVDHDKIRRSRPALNPQAEGCEALAQDAPEFSPGDEVEALSFDGKRWEKTVVDRTEILAGMRHYTVRLASGERHCLPAGSVRRPARAEGCEDLVQRDAPQTPDELCQRIVDCNPATFRPRTPTGEELAEMAREDAHG